MKSFPFQRALKQCLYLEHEADARGHFVVDRRLLEPVEVLVHQRLGLVGVEQPAARPHEMAKAFEILRL